MYPINEQVATRSNALGRGTGLGVGEDGDPAYTLQAAHPHMVAFAQNTRDEVRIQGSMIGRSDSNGPQGSGVETDGASFTLNCTDRHGVLQVLNSNGQDLVGALCARDSKGVGTQYVNEGKVIAFAQNTRDEVRVQGDGTISGALAANPGMKQTTYICETAHTGSNGLGVGESDVMPTLDTSASAAVAADAPISMGSLNTNAAIETDMTGTLMARHDCPSVCL